MEVFLIFRFMELHEEGLIEIFIQTHQQRLRNASQCLNEARKRQQITAPTENKTKIKLANFSGAFYVLVIGYFISFFCFVRENVYYRMSKTPSVTTNWLTRRRRGK
jgi:ionotropic glutamate receptor